MQILNVDAGNCCVLGLCILLIGGAWASLIAVPVVESRMVLRHEIRAHASGFIGVRFGSSESFGSVSVIGNLS